jgi:uncharacterized OB-fold protein
LGATTVVLQGNPDAWFHKDAASGELVITICGECGHVEMAANNYRELYEKYQRSLKRESGSA